MAQTEIRKDLPFEVGILHLMDQGGTPVAVAVIKATYEIRTHGLVLAEKQLPIFHAGDPYGEPGKSSYRYEPECAFFKANTDVVLVGNAVAPRRAATNVQVEFAVGALRKRAFVFGDRFWFRSLAGPRLEGPRLFREMPLVYERAFGGWDRSHSNPERHRVEPRNPLGCGYQGAFGKGDDKLPLPNIEDPDDLIRNMDSKPNPVGFGFINPDWQPRASLAGTYDAGWAAGQMPALPPDFNPRFFNGASAGLIANGYLSGNESVSVTNCSEQQFLSFDLPGLPLPRCRFRIAGYRKRVIAESQLDTVVVNTIEKIVALTWRSHILIPRGPEQLLRLQVSPR